MSNNVEDIDNDLRRSRASSAASKRNLQQHYESHNNEFSVETKVKSPTNDSHQSTQGEFFVIFYRFVVFYFSIVEEITEHRYCKFEPGYFSSNFEIFVSN